MNTKITPRQTIAQPNPKEKIIFSEKILNLLQDPKDLKSLKMSCRSFYHQIPELSILEREFNSTNKTPFGPGIGIIGETHHTKRSKAIRSFFEEQAQEGKIHLGLEGEIYQSKTDEYSAPSKLYDDLFSKLKLGPNTFGIEDSIYTLTNVIYDYNQIINLKINTNAKEIIWSFITFEVKEVLQKVSTEDFIKKHGKLIGEFFIQSRKIKNINEWRMFLAKNNKLYESIPQENYIQLALDLSFKLIEYYKKNKVNYNFNSMINFLNNPTPENFNMYLLELTSVRDKIFFKNILTEYYKCLRDNKKFVIIIGNAHRLPLQQLIDNFSKGRIKVSTLDISKY